MTVNAGGRFTLATSADTDASATADGSAVASATDSTTGGSSGTPSDSSSGVSIGAAVAINYVQVTNLAHLPENGTVTSNGATIEAVMNSEHELGASATSGAGGGSVGIAGSVAIDIERLNTAASLGGTLTAGTGSVAITATSRANSDVSAMPADSTVSASSVGIGASVAVALVDDTTAASIFGTLNGGGNVALAATTEHALDVHAKTGAAGGDVAVVPSVAIALSNITTLAFVTSGTALNIGGAFSASADQSASAKTAAEGDAQGADAAIGVTLALTIANHRSEATLARDLTATGAVSLSADGSSDTAADATASASGAPGESSGGATGNGVDQEVASQRSFADATSSSNGGSGTGGADPTPRASTSSGGVSVAAAVAVNLAKSWSRATLVGPITVNAGGRFTLATSANTDAFAGADGTAVTQSGGGGVSIGVAVAINKADIVNTAILPAGNTVNSQGATIQALMRSTHTLGAAAKSGAGGGSVGIAGSVAIDIENITTTASLAGTLNAGTGSVVIRAASDADSEVAATPAEVTLTEAASTPGQAFRVVSLKDISPDSSPLDAHDPNSASGGRVNGLGTVAGNNQITYAATEWGGLYKTIDGGVTWTFLPGHRPMATWDVEVDPTNTQRVYATSFYDGRVMSIAGINVSSDGGATWTHPATATPPAPYNCDAARKGEPSAFGIGIRPDNASNAFIGTNCGVAITTDSGVTWTFVDPTPGDPAGDIWDVVVRAGGPTSQGIIDVCGDDGVLRSTDGGVTWTAGAATAAGLAGGPCSIAASPDEPNVLFLVVGTQVFESDDAGASWAREFNVAVAAQGRIPFVVTNQRSNSGASDVFDLWYGDVSLFRAGCTSFVAGPRCPTADNWDGPFTRFQSVLPPPATQGAHDDAGDLVFDSQAATDACPKIFSSDGGVYRNTDATATCQSPQFEQPVKSPHATWLFAMAGVNRPGAGEDIYFGLQDDGAWGTQNAGAGAPTWISTNCCDSFDFVADENRVIFSVCCRAGAGRLIMAGPGLAGAADLPNLPAGASLLGFTAADTIDRFADKKYVLITDIGMFFTNDITATPTITWTAIPNAPAGACAVRVADTAGSSGTPTFFVQVGICNERTMGTTGDELWKTTGTSGATWTRIDNSGGQAGGIGIFAVDPTDSSRLYASNTRLTSQGGPRMVFSNNAGGAWTADTDLDAFMTGHGAFKYENERGFNNMTAISPAVGFDGVYGYVQPTLLAFDPTDRNLVVAGGRDSGVFLSTNGGADWHLVTDPFNSDTSGTPHLPRPWFAHFEHLSATDVNVYIGTQGRGVWRIKVRLPTPGAPSTTVGVGIGASVAVGLVDDTTTASITGTLNGGGDVTINASTQHLLNVDAKTGASGGDVAVTPAVAIALSKVTTIASVGPSSDALDISGAFTASADQTASAGTNAAGDAQGADAAVGLALGLTIANHKTEATLARDLTAVGAVSLSAHGASDSSASATASAAGAPGESSGGARGSGVDDQVASERSFADATSSSNGGSGTSGADETPSASTSDGGVSVAAAVGINLAKTSSLATIADDITVVAGGRFTLSTSANTDAQAAADGSAVQPPSDASAPADSSGGGSSGDDEDDGDGVSIGVAVAINYARVTNAAILPAGATVTAQGATIEALSGGTNDLGASATSGAGGGSVGIAGSVAVDIENIQTTATVSGSLSAGSGDVSIAAASDSSSGTAALPSEGGVAGVGSVGIGASVAVAVIDDTTTASLTSSLTGADDLSISAATAHLATTKAKTGAAGGDVAVVPSVAITLSNITTLAYVTASATALSLGGAFSASADQSASAMSSASGDAQGADAAIGVALGLTIANHVVEAWTARDISATGAVSITTSQSSDSAADASASAAGAPEDSSPSGAPADPSSSGVTEQVDGQRGFANQLSLDNGGSGDGDAENTPDAETSDGGVSIAAAVGINLAKTISRASLSAGVDIISTGGAFTLTSNADTDAGASGDGSAVTPSGGDVAIGVGVAVNYARVINAAIIPSTATIDAIGVTVGATMHSRHEFYAHAASGAGGGDVGIAGSVAIDIVNLQTTAIIPAGATVNAHGGDVSLAAASDSSTSTTALPAPGDGTVSGATGAGSVGIGASVAVSLMDETTIAGIDGTLIGGHDLSITASTVNELRTDAKTGASSDEVAIAPAVGIALSNVTTRAYLSAGAPVVLTGSAQIIATQSASALTTARGDTEGNDAAIGIALALTIANHTVEAWTDRNITATGSITISAHGASATGAAAVASAAGAPADSSPSAAPADPSSSGVTEQVNDQRGFADQLSLDNNGGGDGDSEETPDAETSDGGVSVAAAVGINIAKTISTSTVGSGVVLSAGGAVTLTTKADTDAAASADGTAVTPEGGDASIGIGVAINYATVANQVRIRSPSTISGNGITISATMNSQHEFAANASSGAGAGDVGIAGSVAINIVNLNTSAVIPANVTVNAGTGDVSIAAASDSSTSTTALPAEAPGDGTVSGVTGAGSVGVGASVAVSIMDDVTLAGIDGTLNGGDDLTITADTINLMNTDARTGASADEVAVAPAVGVALSNVTTYAYANIGNTLTLSGSARISASQTAAALTSARGDTEGADAAIGIAVAVTVANHFVESWTNRSIDAARDVTVSASSSSDSAADASASAAGAPEEDTSSGEPADSSSSGVTQEVDGQRGFADQLSLDNGGSGDGESSDTPNAETDDGGVSVAAAVGVNIAHSISRASLGAGVSITSTGGSFALTSNADMDAGAGADGSAVTNAGGDAAIGVGVAINYARMINTAVIPATATIDAIGVTVSATMHSQHEFYARTSSGAGGGDVGIAGSVSINIVNLQTSAIIPGGATIDAHTGDVSVAAASDSSTSTSALPAEGTSGVSGAGSVGVGASVAVAIMDDVTIAAIETDLPGGRNLIVSATTTNLMTTDAKTGASAAEVAIAPAVGIALSNVTTYAYLTVGNTLSLTGSATISASQIASALTSARGDTEGNDAAIGVALALTIANHKVEAWTDRSINAVGAVSISAGGSSDSSSGAIASAAGAPEEDTSSGEPADSSTSGVTEQVDSQRGFADGLSLDNGESGDGDSEETPNAETDEGGVSVAAAIGINIAQTISRATLGDGVSITSTTGAFSLTTTADTDATARADGSAVTAEGGDASIGVGVAVNYAKVINTIVVPSNAVISAHGVTISSTMHSVHEFASQASSGAGTGDVGIAGSIAINIVNLQTSAVIPAGASVDAHGGDVSVAAASDSTTSTTALPAEGTTGVSGAGSVGVGASVAIAIMDDVTTAAIDGTLTGGANLSVTATTTNGMFTDAKTGASAAEVAVAPAISIVITNLTTRASLGTGAGVDVTGNVVIRAEQTAQAIGRARGDTEGGDASIGVAFVLTIAHHTVEAWSERNITANGSVSVLAYGSSDTRSEATASAAGAPEEDTSSGEPQDSTSGGVTGMINSERGFGDAFAQDNGSAGAGDEGGDTTASTSDGGVSVAAAVSVNIAITRSRAWFADGLTISAGGLLSVKTSANTDAFASGDGSAVSAGDDGTAIGAAVAINYVEIINSASTGNTTISSVGLYVEATMTNVGGDFTHTTGTMTESGAGSEGTGVAGSLAINIVNGNRTEAVVESGAVANVGAGNVTVKAESNEKDVASAAATVTAGETGVGASVSLNILLDSITRAEIEDGARLTGGNNVLITADASRIVETAVAAGAKGGTAVTPAVSLVVLKNDRATARLGSTPDAGTLTVGGSVTIRATHTADVSKTTAKARSEGETAIGADVAINVVLEWSTLAEIARSISGTFVTVTAQTTMDSITSAEASASGASDATDSTGATKDDDADTKANKQVSGNDNTKNTGTGTLPTASSGTDEGNSASSDEAGSSGGGVGVAAAISVNWVDTRNTAAIAGGVTVIGRSGAVAVSAQNHTDATAKSFGLALNTDSLTGGESSNQIGVAIGLNVALIKNKAKIGAGAVVTGNSITVEAITPATERNDFTV